MIDFYLSCGCACVWVDVGRWDSIGLWLQANAALSGLRSCPACPACTLALPTDMEGIINAHMQSQISKVKYISFAFLFFDLQFAHKQAHTHLHPVANLSPSGKKKKTSGEKRKSSSTRPPQEGGRCTSTRRPMTWHFDHWGSGAVSWRGLTLCSLYWWDGLGSETQAVIGNESNSRHPQRGYCGRGHFSLALITASLWIHCTCQQGKWTSAELTRCWMWNLRWSLWSWPCISLQVLLSVVFLLWSSWIFHQCIFLYRLK